MSKLVINSFEDFEKYVGQPLGESEYLQVDQERINLFADATLDHQWIHTDVERAQKESPFKSTIVHGYLTLSLLPYLWNQIIEVNNLKMMINYGIDKMKFGQAVLSGQSVRLSTKLQSLANLRGAVKAEIRFTMDIKETGKKHWRVRLSLFIISTDTTKIARRFLADTLPAHILKTAVLVFLNRLPQFFISFVAKTLPLRLLYKNIALA